MGKLRLLLMSTIMLGSVHYAGPAQAQAQEGPGVSAAEIRLGTWSALTGAFALYGQPGVVGQRAFYRMLNDRGGIGGRMVSLVVEDHAYNPQQAVAAARKLVNSDRVLAIQGAYGTGPSAATFPYLRQEGVPFVTPYAGALDWYKPVQAQIFGAQTLLDYQARAVGRMAGKAGMRRVLVVHAALTAYEKVAENVAPGVRSAQPDATVEMLPVKIGTTDYAPIALDVARRAPDAVVFIGTVPELVALAREVKQQNVRAQIFTYGGNVTSDLLTLGGAAVEGLQSVSLTYTLDSDEPGVREYREAMAKYEPGQAPDYLSLLTFALAKVNAQAMQLAGRPLNRASLMAGYLAMRDYDTGIIGKVTFTPDMHLGTTQVLPVKIENGKWVATGQFVDAMADW
jgi:ABC-type branched-subunit amino acid transport system substrate-binding protein